MTLFIENNLAFADCISCPLNGQKKIFSNAGEKVDVLLLIQSPSRDDAHSGVLMSGSASELVLPVINQYSKNVATISCTACRCFNPSDKKDRPPTGPELKACRGKFMADVKQILDDFKPKVIIAVGAVSRKEYEEKFLKYFPEYSNLNFKSIESPNYIFFNRQLEGKYLSNLHNIMKSTFSVNDTEKIEESFLTYESGMKSMFVSDFQSSVNVGVDIETNGLKIFSKDFIIGTAAVSCDKYTYFFDFRKQGIKSFEVFRDMMALDVRKIYANILFDVVATEFNAGFPCKNYVDLFPLAFLHDNTFGPDKYNLGEILLRYLPEYSSYKSKFWNTVGVGPDGETVVSDMDMGSRVLETNFKDLKLYNCYDSYFTKAGYNKIYSLITPEARELWEKVMVPIFPMVVSTRMSGMKVDQKLLNEYKFVFEQRFAEISKIFSDKYGVTNINSVIQIRKWLFEDLKLKPIKYTDDKVKKGKERKPDAERTPSTDKDVIEHYKNVNPHVKPLYEARRITNLLTNFLPSIEDSMDDSGFIHPNYNMVGIQSGRLSCKSPNLQGIPRDKTNIEFLDKYPFRKVFIARYNDSYVVEFDFSQLETRVTAELSGDPDMIEAFRRGDDIHRYSASVLFGKPQDQISDFERSIAKQLGVFSVLFGASAESNAAKLNISVAEAERHQQAFFQKFGKIKSLIDRVHREAVEKSQINTVFGRTRKFLIKQGRAGINEVQREAFSHRIAGSANDLAFISFARVHQYLLDSGHLCNDVRIVHTVHDSIILDIKRSCLEEVAVKVQSIMAQTPNSVGFKVPFVVDIKIGKSWGSGTSLEKFLKSEAV